MATAPLAIRDYGLLADGLTSALVGRDGSVGWLCLPRFDSGSVFAPLLDPAGAGECCWTPTDPGLVATGRQRYLDDSNVLETEFSSGGARLTLTDWMPARFDGATAPGFSFGALCRRVVCQEGEVELELSCAPRPDYGRAAASWQAAGAVWGASAGETPLWAQASFPLQAGEGGLRGRLQLRAGESAWFVFAWGDDAPAGLDDRRIEDSMRDTTAIWRAWASQAKYDGPYRAAVVRSALALKAMIYAPTGAIVAAPTASLPEALGGPRNWDYRYCWPRDATFALYGLSLLGYHDEAGRFLEFLAKISDTHPLPLQVCYRVDGNSDLTEIELPHLCGYRGSRPVRIGNGAAEQRQLDIYGEVMDAAYTYAKWRDGLEASLWESLRKLVEYAVAHWQEPDESIWEVRGGRQQFVYSKVMCWVAVDRGVKLIQRYHLPGPLGAWEACREAIRHEVRRRGYNPQVHAFTQTYDNTALDASLLLLPLIRFCSPHDPRMCATIERIRQHLGRNSFIQRYQNVNADGVGGREGAFSICTFWMIDCLTLLGRAGDARAMFERMLTHASPLGLFSEELDTETGEFLGNFPQAFTHMALLNSAHNLELYPQGVA